MLSYDLPVRALGMTFSVMLLVPSWASAGKALLTLNRAWHRVRDDASLRFMFVAAVFYGLSTFEGSFLAIARSMRLHITLTGRWGTCIPARLAGWQWVPLERGHHPRLNVAHS